MTAKLKEAAAAVFCLYMVIIGFTAGPCLVGFMAFSAVSEALEGRYISAAIAGVVVLIPSVALMLWLFTVGIDFVNILRGRDAE